MGRRSAAETACQVLLAFMQQQVWSQAELAKRCDVGSRALRAVLVTLSNEGMPLTSEQDWPNTYWSVPNSWRPAGWAISEDDRKRIARLLARLPETPARQRALRAVASVRSEVRQVQDATALARDEVLEALELGMREKQVVEIEYYSASTGLLAKRNVSIHRIVHDQPTRVYATCHSKGALQRFRYSRIRSARSSGELSYRPEEEAAVDAAVQQSVDGYSSEGEVMTCGFTVRLPEARWARDTLPVQAFQESATAESIRFVVVTAAVDVLARFVVSLGAAARADTPELRAAVVALARGSLGQNEGGRNN